MKPRQDIWDIKVNQQRLQGCEQRFIDYPETPPKHRAVQSVFAQLNSFMPHKHPGFMISSINTSFLLSSCLHFSNQETSLVRLRGILYTATLAQDKL